MIYNVLDYGAVPDGKTLSTDAIQSAINACNKNGGGRVLIPSGNFYSGSLYLLDNVELHLEHGAVLMASGNIDDYNPDDAYFQNYGAPSEQWRPKHFIMAIERDNVSITGSGIIDGNGESFRKPADPPLPYAYVWMYGTSRVKDEEVMRPGQLICFVESTNICVRGITVRNAPSWTIFVYGCEYVRINAVQIFNHKTALNTDGIDIDSSRYVTISDCNIDTGDDAITFRCATQRLKRPRICEYITVTNCNCAVSADVFRIGVGFGTIRHIRVSNITVERAGKILDYMTSYRGRGEAKIEDVNFSNISAAFCSTPICLRGDRGYIKNVSVENLRANCIANISIIGNEESKISNINLKNIETYILPEEREITDKHREYRGDYMVEVKNVENVTLDNVRVFAEDAALPAWSGKFNVENSTGIAVTNCNFNI